jgi:serine protease AprX
LKEECCFIKVDLIMRQKTFLFLLLVLPFWGFSNSTDGNVYWVQLNSKDKTPYSINEPQLFLSQRAIERRKRMNIVIDSTDFPVNPVFIDSLSKIGFIKKHTSRWMNGIIAEYSGEIPIDSLSLPSFVSGIEIRKEPPLKSQQKKFEEPDSSLYQKYGNAYIQLTMIGGDIVHKYSKGEGIHIAVIDAGFLNVDLLDVFDSLRSRGGILGTFDFVNPGNDVYREHSHGTNVLSIMAANLPVKMVGTAPEASYWLFRTEDGPTEYPVEEDYWVVAVEFADSAGCDITNTSLGYTYFDNPQMSHNHGKFTGDSIRISKAANLAVKKGMVMICSAGNDGANKWEHISAPAEARDVIAVGAVDYLGNVAYFSSRGYNDNTKPPKPDVTAIGAGTVITNTSGWVSSGNGTSFSGPVITGMAACLIAAYPEANAYKISDMIRESGSSYPSHNDSLGYGIPDFSIYFPPVKIDLHKENSTLTIYPNPFSNTIAIEPSTVSKIIVTTLTGKEIFNINTETDSTVKNIDLSHLKSGFYIIRIIEKGKTTTRKILKR